MVPRVVCQGITKFSQLTHSEFADVTTHPPLDRVEGGNEKTGVHIVYVKLGLMKGAQLLVLISI